MKTPRELLLSKHESSTAGLDAVRTQVLRDHFYSKETRPPGIVEQIWIQLFWSSRRVWLGFAATWILLGIINLWTTGTPGNTMAAKTTTIPSPAVQTALLEQRRLCMELLELPSPPLQTGTDTKKASSPRSEIYRHKHPNSKQHYS